MTNFTYFFWLGVWQYINVYLLIELLEKSINSYKKKLSCRFELYVIEEFLNDVTPTHGAECGH